MEFPAEIVDAHHHLWNPVSNDPDVGYVWLKKIGDPKPFGDPSAIQRDYLLPEFLAETRIPLTASVHVQADGAIADPVAETRFIQSTSDNAGFPVSIVGFVDFSRDDAEAVILRHKLFAGFTGTRQILSRLDDTPELSFANRHFVGDTMWQDNFTLLKEHGLSFDLQLYPEQMEQACGFLANHPDVPVIIDHAGSPYDKTQKGFGLWKEGMSLLASLPNVSAKISGLGMFDLHLGGGRDSRPFIETIFELFGPERVLFGSNFPVDKLMTTYDDSVANIVRCLPSGEAGRQISEMVFAENARRIYRL